MGEVLGAERLRMFFRKKPNSGPLVSGDQLVERRPVAGLQANHGRSSSSRAAGSRRRRRSFGRGDDRGRVGGDGFGGTSVMIGRRAGNPGRTGDDGSADGGRTA